MDTVLTALKPKGTTKTLHFSNERWSVVFGLFECFDPDRELDETGELPSLEDDAAYEDPETCVKWGNALIAALESQRVYRSVSPRANDGSLRDGISEYLMASLTEDIWEDSSGEDERFELYPEDADYKWLAEFAAFLRTCGGARATRVKAPKSTGKGKSKIKSA